jgi:predicted HTH domain antitoxin
VVHVELPAQVVDAFGSAEAAAARLRQFAVMDLLRRHKISRGRAAELLGVTYHDVLDLLAEWDVPYFDLTNEELDEDIAAAQTAARATRQEPRPHA